MLMKCVSGIKTIFATASKILLTLRVHKSDYEAY